MSGEDGTALSGERYRSILAAAETYREALVIRLCGEAGCRPAELARVRPGDVDRVREDPPRYLLRIPPTDDGGGNRGDSGGSDTDGSDRDGGDADGTGPAARADPGAGDDPGIGDGAGGEASDSGAGRRTAYLPSDVAQELRRYARSNGIDADEALFPVTARRLQMLVSEVTDRAADRAGRADLATVASDDLRRYFTRRALVDFEINPRVVKAVGGWASFESLEPYLPTPEDDEIVAAFEAVEVDEPDRTATHGDRDASALGPLLSATDRCALVRLDADGYVERWNRSAATVFGYDAEAVVGTHVSVFFTDDAVAEGDPDQFLTEAAEAGGTEADGWLVRADGTRFRAHKVISSLRDAGGRRRGFAVLVLDVSPYHERYERAAARRREADRLGAVARRFRAVSGALLGSTSHEEVETGACEALVDGEAYDVAWIDRTLPADRRDEWRTTAEIEPAEVDRVLDRLADRESGADPVMANGGREDAAVVDGGPASLADRFADAREGDADGEMIRGGDADPNGTDESANAADGEGDDGGAGVTVVREVSAERSDGTPFEGDLASVELAYGDTVYGRLTVGTTRPDAFGPEERFWLATAGRQIGYAVAATRRRTLLLADSLLEVEFRCRDERAFFVDASARLGCQFELISLVGVSESTKLYYVHLSGAEPGDVFDLADENPGIEDWRLIETRPDGWRIELTVQGRSPALTLTEYGATVVEAAFEGGQGTITVECAPDADLRTVAGGLRAAFPDTELRGKREVERSVRTAREFREGIEERLTDKQEAALRAAYFAGYYDWPRESTAEEVADAMGVSSPTLHNHLRKGQHELLRTVFDADSIEE